MPGSPVLHCLPEFSQIHVHWVGDAIHLSHPLPAPSVAFDLSQHQGLFQWISSSHQGAKVLALQHQSFRWIFRVDLFYDWLVWLLGKLTIIYLQILLLHNSLHSFILEFLLNKCGNLRNVLHTLVTFSFFWLPHLILNISVLCCSLKMHCVLSWSSSIHCIVYFNNRVAYFQDF